MTASGAVTPHTACLLCTPSSHPVHRRFAAIGGGLACTLSRCRTRSRKRSRQVRPVSEKDGRLKWQGRVSGDSIEGTFIHYRKPSFFRRNPDPVEHWFKGKLWT